MSENTKIPTTQRAWEVGDPIEIPLEQRLQVILQKVIAERNQYETTAIGLNYLVGVYKTNYEKACEEFKRLKGPRPGGESDGTA